MFVLGATVIGAVVNSIANRGVDWSERCSEYEIRQGVAGNRFDSIQIALTQEKFTRADLRRLRQQIWQNLPLCRELVEFVSLSIQLYNDLLFSEAVPELSDKLTDLQEYERWYELFLRLHRT